MKSYPQLLPGALVRAARRLDPVGANAQEGELGVVFEPSDPENGYGPMVRWFSGGCCNVYDGDIVVVIR